MARRGAAGRLPGARRLPRGRAPAGACPPRHARVSHALFNSRAGQLLTHGPNVRPGSDRIGPAWAADGTAALWPVVVLLRAVWLVAGLYHPPELPPKPAHPAGPR